MLASGVSAPLMGAVGRAVPYRAWGRVTYKSARLSPANDKACFQGVCIWDKAGQVWVEVWVEEFGEWWEKALGLRQSQSGPPEHQQGMFPAPRLSPIGKNPDLDLSLGF